MSESSAAAITCGLHINGTQEQRDKKVVVFHFGGHSLDVTILKVVNGHFTTLATKVDYHLGGQDIDNALVERFYAVIEE